MEEKVLAAVKKLLTFQKMAEISTTTSENPVKYSSIGELVMAKFPVDRTISLINKSVSMFAQSPEKMKDWISFL